MVKTSPSNAGGAGLIPSRGAEIPHALWPKNQNIKQKQYCYKFNKAFKKWSTSEVLKKKTTSPLNNAKSFSFQQNQYIHSFQLAHNTRTTQY